MLKKECIDDASMKLPPPENQSCARGEIAQADAITASLQVTRWKARRFCNISRRVSPSFSYSFLEFTYFEG